jgi:oxygen-independent coproporphyrinogen III oxidase
MAGIYIHIPFCRSKCHYCNFVSVASQKYQSEYIDAICKEIHQQKNFFSSGIEVETIYFGGGTPSLLYPDETIKILETVYKEFKITPDAEITFEVNPDDADTARLKSLLQAGINRLSIGTQSFHDQELQYLGRKHDARKGISSFHLARDVGYTNISLDIIFGLPREVAQSPVHNLEQLLILNPEHISAYSLTMEPDTILSVLSAKGKMLSPDEDIAVDYFRFYMESLCDACYEHYEISNYARPGFRSKHNAAYWQSKPYLGVGAGAHSYDLQTRTANVSAIRKYMEGIINGTPFREREILTLKDKYHDYILTSIRTSEGISFAYIRKVFGENFLSHIRKYAGEYIESGMLISDGSVLKLSNTGKLWTDRISEKLMV